MIEAVPDEEAGAGIVSENETIQSGAVLGRIDREIPPPARDRRLRELRGADLAIAGVGVRGKETGKLLPLALRDALQHRVRAGYLARVVARLRRVPHSQLVRLRFVVAAVFQEEESEPLLRQAAVRPEGADEDGSDEQPDACDLGACDLLGAVPRGDVADFVAQYARQLCFRIQIGDDAAGNVDVTARNRERVDDRTVEHAKVPVERRQVGRRSELLPDRIDVVLHGGVPVETVFRLDGRVSLAPHLQLLARADE